MVEKIQQGDIISLTVHDEAKTATIQFFPRNGTGPLFVVTELKLTNNNESAFSAMESAAALGLSRINVPGNQVQVRYDSPGNELDEITVR
jgi:hypothetical protein